MDNNTLSYDLPPLPTYTLQPLPSIFPGIPDQYLVLALPVVAYWAVSLIFHCLDEWDFFPQYRLHTPAEVLKRNRASRWDVFRDVIIQQVVQTVVGMGLAFTEGVPMFGREEYDIAVWARRIRWLQRGIPGLLAVLGVDAQGLVQKLAEDHTTLAGAVAGGVYPQFVQTITLMGENTITPAFAPWELLVAKVMYYYAIPALQFLIAICIVDTWQYFMHRGFHMNKYLYNTIHSRHHRLYVPYAYGALYNHPLEGLFMDTLGAGVAYLVTGMTCRQSMWFFTCSTIKTVDDHCGYVFPWDPLQHLTSNNAGYHDVHHQSWGIKANFSQPFFTFWDSLLGTKWVGGDVSARYERAKVAAQKQVDADRASSTVTGSVASESTHKATAAAPYEDEASNATSKARTAHIVAEPRIPAGKATLQAIGSRQQILDDTSSAGGVAVLADETSEEIRAQAQNMNQTSVRRSPRKRAPSSGLKGFADLVGESLHGRGTGVLGMESGRR